MEKLKEAKDTMEGLKGTLSKFSIGMGVMSAAFLVASCVTIVAMDAMIRMPKHKAFS